MITAGIIIKGAANKGKSTTIIKLKNLLIDKLKPLGAVIDDTPINFANNQKHGGISRDCRTVITYNGKKLLILSLADESLFLQKNYEAGDVSNIDFVVGAARSRGATIKFWQDRVTHIEWKTKKIACDQEERVIIDHCYARLLELFAIV